MTRFHPNKKDVVLSGIVLGVFVFLCPLQAGGIGKSEQIPTFSAGAAIAALRFDRAEAISQTGPPASRFSLSYLGLPGKRLSGNSQMPELEPIETYGAFFGLKITLKLRGGWSVFSGGDIEDGIVGAYEGAVNLITASGAPIIQNQKESNHAGLEIGGDLIYCLTSRFGIGIGASRFKTAKKSVLIYEGMYEDIYTDPARLNMRPEIRVSVFRLGLFYAFPFAGRLAVSVHGGPALYSAEYSFNMGVTYFGFYVDPIQAGFIPTAWYQESKSGARQIGLEGGVAFDFNANPYVAFFVEVQGRYAKVGGFEGEEEAIYFNKPPEHTKSGTAYYVASGKYPLLDVVPPEGAASGSARKATLDFSGFSFMAGLKLRF
jgi:hypothetical protein